MNDDAFDKLSKLKVGALFMETGTGKTKIALDLMAYKAHKVDYLLWICPCSLKDEIESERRKWHPELVFDVVGCESIGQSDRVFLDVLRNVKERTSFVIVDESLKIKNASAKRTQRIIEIGDNAEYKLILNGTPVSKNAVDLWTQMEFLSPKILNMTIREFDYRYVQYSDVKSPNGYTKRVPVGSKHTDNLIGLISPYIFEARLDIDSKKHYHTYRYDMNDDERTGYEDLKTELFFGKGSGGLDDLRDIDFYTITTKLQHYYCGASDRSVLLDEIVKDLDGKAVVFVKYLDSIPSDSPHIDGSVKDRRKVIEGFKGSDERLLYITYGCGSFGLNLQFVHNMIFLEHGFDYAQRIQAEARIYRMGQTQDVHYYDLECRIGLEKLFTRCTWKKKDFLEEVKCSIQAYGVKAL